MAPEARREPFDKLSITGNHPLFLLPAERRKLSAPTWIFCDSATLGSETFIRAMNANLRNVINQAFFAVGKKQVNCPEL